MKLKIILFIIVTTTRTFSQTTDTTTTFKTLDSSNTLFKGIQSNGEFNSGKQKVIIVRDNVVIESNEFQLNLIENEIADIESSEIKALLKRDTAALKKIWSRDFTLEEPQNKVNFEKNPLPRYVSLNRTILKITILDNVVYTSGREYSQLLRRDGRLDDPIERDFFHTWKNRYGVWRMSTKK